jgi:hypothetical protein
VHAVAVAFIEDAERVSVSVDRQEFEFGVVSGG